MHNLNVIMKEQTTPEWENCIEKYFKWSVYFQNANDMKDKETVPD
jgi:hypothetical protein